MTWYLCAAERDKDLKLLEASAEGGGKALIPKALDADDEEEEDESSDDDSDDEVSCLFFLSLSVVWNALILGDWRKNLYVVFQAMKAAIRVLRNNKAII